MPEPDQKTTYRLNDGKLLARLMRCPDRGGKRHTVRSLSAATGISKSTISKMTRERPTRPLPAPQATLLAEQVGVHRKALFTPTVSVFADTDKDKEGER